MIKVFEAFAGYGSQSIALRNLGVEHEVVAISEIDKYALQAYYSLHDTDIPNLGDISKIKVEDIPKHDLFTYSFPCTDISVAGKQEGIIKGQTRSGLLYECERIIEHCKPKYLLMENVKNLVGKKFKTQFDEWLKYLESLGYTNYWKVLNAKDYGNIPQNRERVFVVSVLEEHEPYEFPKTIKLDKVIKDMLENQVDEKYYLSDERLMKIYNWKAYKRPLEKVLGASAICPTLTARGAGEWHSGMITLSDDFKETTNVDKIIQNIENDTKIKIPQATKKGFIEMDLDGVCDLSYPTSKTRRGRVQEGGNICPTLTATQQNIVKIEYKDKSIELPCICASRGRNPENPSSRIIGEPTAQRIEINTKGTSNTITTVQKDNYAIEENFRIRKLTPRECFRLMGMNDNDIDKIQETGISNTQQYKMAGNSIVVNVLEEIFRNLFIGQDISKTPSR